MQELRQNIKKIMDPQKTPHKSHWRASYGVFFVDILEKIDRVLTAPHCIIHEAPMVPFTTND